jgi:hypothetical protein
VSQFNYTMDGYTCSDITYNYTATLSNGNALPYFISFNSYTRTFTVNTVNSSDVETYYISIIG